MASIINELADVMDQRPVGPIVSQLVARADEQTVTVIAIELLTWLGRSTRTLRHRPMILKPHHKWCGILKDWINNDSELSHLFTIEGNLLDFSDDISSELRGEMQRLAATRYHPRPIV